jgi:hypothetical protein
MQKELRCFFRQEFLIHTWCCGSWASEAFLFRPLRRTRRWRLDDLERVEVLRAWKMEDVKLVLRNGERLLLFRARLGRIGRSPDEIAAFAKLPLERKDLT